MSPQPNVPRSTVEVSMDLARVHLFDAETGDAIVHGLTGEIETPSRQQADDLSA